MQNLLARLPLVIATVLVSLAPSTRAEEPAQEDFPVIDFSYAGYSGGGALLPMVPAVLRVKPSGGDDTALLQAALDHIAALPLQADGFRGALVLAPERFRVAGQLHMHASGIVLRGGTDAQSAGSAIIVATGLDRRTLIEIGNESAPELSKPIRVADGTVPAGSRTLTLENSESLSRGDRVAITRPSTAEWISALGMNHFPGPFADQRLDWLPGSRDLVWDRVIAEIDPEKKQITLDAPITSALEQRFGGGFVAKVTANEPLRNIGVENLSLTSEFDAANPCDEEHAWIAIALDHVEDAWVRSVTARHFAGSAVRVGARARRITIEDCRSEAPVSEPSGYRRQSFLVEGQQVLVRRCAAEASMNGFALGLCAAGPNVFLDCTAKSALGASGSFESWASGVLYERVKIEGAGLRLTYDMERAQGGGWTAANCVVWNCEAKAIEARAPDGALNLVKTSPEPLYETQLAKRLGTSVAASNAKVYERDADATEFHFEKTAASGSDAPLHPIEIVNGRFVVNGRALWGGAVNDAWWLGQINPATALNCGISITRFVPGRVGPGLTEDLPRLAAKISENGTPFYQSGPGLWYDRRRDEHSNTPRDENVWAPFYEMPWARSGLCENGRTNDGLSKFDLTRFNPWYFSRTREFARLCERHGIVLYHSLYNTHNLLEIGPHWVDYPFRPANCINETGLPEPPPFEPGNRLHVGNQFYDAENPKLRELHRAFIFHVLDELGREPNVIFGVAFQFAGPLAFQEFFQDTVAEWEKKNARSVRLVLATSKDISDAILASPARAKQVAVIDMRYWQYRPDGTLWAPKANVPGGQNLAFREMIAKGFGKMGDAPPLTTPQQLYRQVREYRDRFPDKAIVAWNGGVGPIPILMAGGAQALMRNPTAGHGQGRQVDRTTLDPFVREHLADVLMKMTPRDNWLAAPDHTWCLADDAGKNALIYSLEGSAVTLAKDLPQKSYSALWFDPRTGKTQAASAPDSWSKDAQIEKPTAEDWLLLLKSEPPPP